MHYHLILRPAAIVFAAICLINPVAAQDTPDPSKVMATVNGVEITLGHVIALRSGLPPQYDQLPSDVLFKGILDQLIQQTLLMQSLDGEPSRLNQLLIENERRAIVAGQVANEVMNTDLSNDAIQAAYDDKYANAEQETEYRASHILVKTVEEAKLLVEELQGDADFAALAQEHSIGPSGPSGGDLGWFGGGVMIDVFFNAVAALEPGEVSQPVETEFGWHVIKLVETRVKERPQLDDVRAQLTEELRQAAFEDYVAGLEKSAEIERADTDGFDPKVINNLDILEN